MKTIYLSGIVGYEITADNIRSQISEGSKEKLQVIVNSPGGFVIDAFEIFNIFNMYKGEVEFVINGMAASAMSYIIMAGDKISAFKNSIFMAHKAQSIAFGDSDMIQTEADIARAMDNILAEAYTARMKKSKEEILSDMKNEIWHIGWEALTDAGIIDNVIDSPDEITIPDEEMDRVVFMMDEPDKERAAILVKTCLSRMRNDVERIKTNSMKAAALLKTESQPEVIPVVDNIITEDKMNLQEFLKANPEAKAEYDKDLLSAEEKGRAENVNVQAKIAKILTLEGVTISPEAKAAIDGSMAMEDYKDSIILSQKNARAEKQDSSPFAGLVAKQTPKEQDPAGAGVVEFDKEAVRAQAKKLVSELGV